MDYFPDAVQVDLVPDGGDAGWSLLFRMRPGTKPNGFVKAVPPATPTVIESQSLSRQSVGDAIGTDKLDDEAALLSLAEDLIREAGYEVSDVQAPPSRPWSIRCWLLVPQS